MFASIDATSACALACVSSTASGETAPGHAPSDPLAAVAPAGSGLREKLGLGLKAMRVLGISGSLRRGSYNSALLRAATALMPEEATLEVASIRGIGTLTNTISGSVSSDGSTAIADEIAFVGAVTVHEQQETSCSPAARR